MEPDAGGHLGGEVEVRGTDAHGVPEEVVEVQGDRSGGRCRRDAFPERPVREGLVGGFLHRGGVHQRRVGSEPGAVEVGGSVSEVRRGHSATEHRRSSLDDHGSASTGLTRWPTREANGQVLRGRRLTKRDLRAVAVDRRATAPYSCARERESSGRVGRRRIGGKVDRRKLRQLGQRVTTNPGARDSADEQVRQGSPVSVASSTSGRCLLSVSYPDGPGPGPDGSPRWAISCVPSSCDHPQHFLEGGLTLERLSQAALAQGHHPLFTASVDVVRTPPSMIMRSISSVTTSSSRSALRPR